MTKRRMERGTSTPIPRVLLDGPDFQRLPPIARHVFLTLKVSFGPSGIETQYADALVATLAARTGWAAGEVAVALDQIERGAWIEREANVLWITKQLAFHPSMVLANPNHRLSIQGHITGLPRLPIVRRFIEAYRPWFTEVPDVLDGYPASTPVALTLVSSDPDGITNPIAITETKTQTETQNETETSCPSDARETGPDLSLLAFAEFWGLYPRRKGTNSRQAAEKCWRARVKEGESPDVMLDGVKQYAAHCMAEGKIGTPFVMQASRFLGPDKHYLDIDAFSTDDGPNPPIVLPDGSGFTEYGELMTGAGTPHPARVAAMRAAWRQTPEGRAAMAEWQAKKPARIAVGQNTQPAPSKYAAALGGRA